MSNNWPHHYMQQPLDSERTNHVPEKMIEECLRSYGVFPDEAKRIANLICRQSEIEGMTRSHDRRIAAAEETSRSAEMHAKNSAELSIKLSAEIDDLESRIKELDKLTVELATNERRDRVQQRQLAERLEVFETWRTEQNSKTFLMWRDLLNERDRLNERQPKRKQAMTDSNNPDTTNADAFDLDRSEGLGSLLSRTFDEAREGMADGAAAGFAEVAGRTLVQKAVELGAPRSLAANPIVIAFATMFAPFMVLLAVTLLGERLGTKGEKLKRLAERAVRGTVTTNTATATTFLLGWCTELMAQFLGEKPSEPQQLAAPAPSLLDSMTFAPEGFAPEPAKARVNATAPAT